MTALLDFLMLPLVDGGAAYDLTKAIAFAMMCVFLIALLARSPLLREESEPLGDDPLKEAFGRWGRDERAGRAVSATLVVAAVVLSATYFARATTYERYLHRWDAFHTVIGAKYHDELGYFDLYKCSIAVDKTGQRYFSHVKDVRNLRTRKIVEVKEHLKGNDCVARFSPERLAEFRADLDIIGPSMSSEAWQRLFHDKGFNGTPFYTVVTTALLGLSGTSIDQLTKVAFLDVLLMLAAFGSVGWAFGAKRAALFALFFCCFFPNRFIHMGGSILRFDYVAALIVALCALKKEKWGLAGVLMAWAGMVRAFPFIFAGAVFLKIAAEIYATRRWERKYTIFTSAFAGSLLLFFLVSFAGLDGAFDDWREWALNMKVHTKTSASFRVGFRHLFMLDGSIERVKYRAMEETFGARRAFFFGTVGLLLTPMLLSIRRLDYVTFASLFGAVGFFLTVIATRYYYSVFTLVFLVDRDMFRNRTLLISGAMLFGFSAFDFFFFETYENTALMYNFILGSQLTAFVAVLGYGLLFDPGLADGAPASATCAVPGSALVFGADSMPAPQSASTPQSASAPPSASAQESGPGQEDLRGKAADPNDDALPLDQRKAGVSN